MCSRARDNMGRPWRDSFREANTRPCPGADNRRLGHDPAHMVVMFDFEAVRPAEIDIPGAVPYE